MDASSKTLKVSLIRAGLRALARPVGTVHTRRAPSVQAVRRRVRLPSTKPTGVLGESCMRWRYRGSMLLLVLLCSLGLAASDAGAQTVKVTGSGASFPFPLYGR